MKIQQISNTNFGATIWPKNNLIKFQRDQLIKDFAEKTKEYPDLVLEQVRVSPFTNGLDTFKLYLNKNLTESLTENFACYSKNLKQEKLLDEYIKIFYSMTDRAKAEGHTL